MAHENKLKSRLVFIDTCCFISKHFNFGIDSLGRTQRYIEEGKIHLLMPDITKSEIEKKIHLAAEKAHLKLKLVFEKDKENELKIMTVADGLPYSGKPQIPTVDDIFKKIYEKFEEFIDSPNVEIVSTEHVNPKVIFDNYFNSKPPFGKESKKHEFPDAFVLEAIKDISKSRHQTIYVISLDPDLKSYTQLHENLISLDNINNLNSLIIHNDEELKVPAQFADDVFTFMEKDIFNRAFEHFKRAEYQASDISEDLFSDVIDNVTINKLKISEHNLLNVTENNAEYQVIFSVDLKVDFSVPDYDNAIYDREDGRMYNLEYKKFSENYHKEYSAYITLFFEDRIKENAEIYDIKFEDDIFDVN